MNIRTPKEPFSNFEVTAPPSPQAVKTQPKEDSTNPPDYDHGYVIHEPPHGDAKRRKSPSSFDELNSGKS